jgi:hypothetical protein
MEINDRQAARPPASNPSDEILKSLENLQRELQTNGFTAQIVKHRTKPPTLRVRNPDAAEMSDEITCAPYPADNDDPWFFYSWGHPISGVEHVALAVLSVTHVLRSET